MAAGSAELAAIGAFVVIAIAGGPALLLVVTRQLPWNISRRLQKGRKSITTRTMYSGGAWNPAKPLGRNNSTPNEPGSATYTLTSEGLIHLELVRADGRHEHFEGPPVQPPPGATRPRRGGMVTTLAYAAAAVVGLALGYGLDRGGTTADRLQDGVLGALGTWIVAVLGMTLAVGLYQLRLHRSQHARSDEKP